MKHALLVVTAVNCAAQPAARVITPPPAPVPQPVAVGPLPPVTPIDDIELVHLTTLEDGLALFSHKWPLPDVGAHYLVFDAFGVAGHVEILGTSMVDVSGGTGQFLRVGITSGAVPRAHAVALGPMPVDALAFARMLPVAAPSPLDEGIWRTTGSIDLDRDATPDLFEVERCSHRHPSGCTASVCDQRAHGLRWGASAPRLVWSENLVPDVDDCLPTAP